MNSSKRMAYSISALDTFTTCPKKFWHLRIRKDYKDPGGAAADYGKAYHKAVENLIKHGTELPLQFTPVKRYIDKYLAMRKKGVEVIAEQQLALNWDGEPCDWFAKTVMVRAIIDITILGDTSVTIIDLKTGKMKDDGFLQLRLCAALLHRYIPRLTTFNLGYLWLKEDAFTSTVITVDELPEVWVDLQPRIRRYQEAFQRDEYPARESGLCKRYCPITSCPFNGLGD